MAQTPSRYAVTDPATNQAIQDIYNKLAQVQSTLSSPLIKAGTYTMAVGTKITVNAQGQITAIS